MVHISNETERQTDERLRRVIVNSEFRVYEGTYTFEEFPLSDFKSKVNPDSLALIRDDEVWSQLVPSENSSKELFTVFSFHFKEGDDNSGFVGWLATLLKRELGTGVFVTCGQNSNKGGIFDYWGCPVVVGEEAVRIINGLVKHDA